MLLVYMAISSFIKGPVLFWPFPQTFPKNFIYLPLSKLVDQLFLGPATFGSYFGSLVHERLTEQGDYESRAGGNLLESCSSHFFEFLALVALFCLLRH